METIKKDGRTSRQGMDWWPRRYRFHFRIQGNVHDCYRQHPLRIGKAIRFALDRFAVAARGGTIRLDRTSRFLARDDVSDKVELHVILAAGDKDLIEKLAFSLGISQAEALRMALEWYMEVVWLQSSREVCVRARRKWHHSRPVPVPETMLFSIWRHGRQLFWQFPQQIDINRALDARKNRFYGR